MRLKISNLELLCCNGLIANRHYAAYYSTKVIIFFEKDVIGSIKCYKFMSIPKLICEENIGIKSKEE